MNKRYILLALSTLFLSACKKSTSIHFDVTANGLNDGVFVIQNQGRQTVFGENIKNGTCTLKGIMEEPGFYLLDVTKTNGKEHLPFEVYLEPGKYAVTADAGNLEKYPKIETDSKKQQEINNYNALDNELGKGIEQETANLNKELEAKKNTLSENAYRNLVGKIADSEDKERNIQYVVLEKFIEKYPESELAAHFMAKQNYGDSPKKYAELYAKLSPAAKSSEDGKDLAKALDIALKLQPGKKAPAIAGKTFDGKTFAAITAGKKVFLIDFWRSANQFSRTNHEKMLNIYNNLKGRGFEVISVSLDSKPLWWSTAVKDDKLPWPQMCDLKGNDSPNRENWNISTIPTYYLVDDNWNIYKKDIGLGQVELEATQYLNKHH